MTREPRIILGDDFGQFGRGGGLDGEGLCFLVFSRGYGMKRKDESREWKVES